MVIVYAAILCLSAFLAAWAGARLLRRMAALIPGVLPLGMAILLPASGFLMVVGAPGPVLMGALLVSGLLAYRPRTPTYGLCASAVLVGLLGFQPATASYLSSLPFAAVLAAAGILWWGLVALAAWASPQARPVHGVLASLLPLVGALLQQPEAGSILLDAALIASACLGVVGASGRHIGYGLPTHLGLALLLGYLQIAALWQGAWIAALVSMVVWVVANVWSRTHLLPPERTGQYA